MAGGDSTADKGVLGAGSRYAAALVSYLETGGEICDSAEFMQQW